MKDNDPYVVIFLAILCINIICVFALLEFPLFIWFLYVIVSIMTLSKKVKSLEKQIKEKGD